MLLESDSNLGNAGVVWCIAENSGKRYAGNNQDVIIYSMYDATKEEAGE
jgi:hypothetical protein